MIKIVFDKKRVKYMLFGKKENFFNNIIYLLLSANIVLGFLTIIPTQISNIIIVLLGGTSLIYTYCNVPFKKMNAFTIFLILYTICGFISWVWNGNADLVEMLWPIGFMGIGIMITNYSISNTLTGGIFFVVCLSLILKIVISGGVDYINGSSSRNSIGVFVVLFLALHMISAYKQKKSVSILYPVMASITCLMAVGRSGAILAALIMLLFFIFVYKNGYSYIRSLKYLMGFVVIIIIVMVIVIDFFPSIIDNVIFNFEWRGLKTARTSIWSDYMSKAFYDGSIGNILFGAPIKGTFLLDYYSENLHNSFLMLHAKYGLLGCCLIIFLLFNSIKTLIYEKNMYILSPCIMMLFRMNFDYTNFNGVLDILMIVILLYPFFREKFEKDNGKIEYEY